LLTEKIVLDRKQKAIWQGGDLGRLLKKAKYRLLTRAAQKRGRMFAGTYRAVIVRERWPTAFLSSLLDLRYNWAENEVL